MSINEPAVTELPISCPDCGGLLLAAVGPPDAKVGVSTWACPFCKKPQSADFGGQLHWIVKRSQPVTVA